MGKFFNEVLKTPVSSIDMPLQTVVALLLHSVILGVILVCVTFLTANALSKGVQYSNQKKAEMKEIIGAANLMFLTVGLAGTMLLVNNNLVRAFAIAAAVALVRFKVKLSRNELNSTYLFAVIAGMACGLNELVIAWTTTAFYTGLVLLLNMALRILDYAAPSTEDTVSTIPVASELPHQNDLSLKSKL